MRKTVDVVLIELWHCVCQLEIELFSREKEAVAKIEVFEAASALGSVNRAFRSLEDGLAEILPSRLAALYLVAAMLTTQKMPGVRVKVFL